MIRGEAIYEICILLYFSTGNIKFLRYVDTHETVSLTDPLTNPWIASTAVESRHHAMCSWKPVRLACHVGSTCITQHSLHQRRSWTANFLGKVRCFPTTTQDPVNAVMCEEHVLLLESTNFKIRVYRGLGPAPLGRKVRNKMQHS